MNSCVSSKLMLFEVNPLEFAIYDAKCPGFARGIPAISIAKKILGSEKVRLPYRKPTPVGESRRLR